MCASPSALVRSRRRRRLTREGRRPLEAPMSTLDSDPVWRARRSVPPDCGRARGHADHTTHAATEETGPQDVSFSNANTSDEASRWVDVFNPRIRVEKGSSVDVKLSTDSTPRSRCQRSFDESFIVPPGAAGAPRGDVLSKTAFGLIC